MTTITQSLNLTGKGLYASQSKQVTFLKQGKSYLPSADPNLVKTTTLTANLTQSATIMRLGNVSNVPVPNLNVNQYGGLRVGAEVIVYSQVFAGNSSVDVVQRNLANTGAAYTGNIASGTLVSILGLRTLPISRKLYVYNGNVVFLSSNLGLGYYAANVGVTISSPDRRDGNTAVASSVYLFANGAVQAISITNRGTGYFNNPVITVTGPNTVPFSGNATLSIL